MTSMMRIANRSCKQMLARHMSTNIKSVQSLAVIGSGQMVR
jgi:hypothetical protein